jgi:acyl-CoA thioesterase II
MTTTGPSTTVPSTTGPTSEIFTNAATLKPADPERFDAAFTGVTQPCPWPKAYGGDLVAQAAVAAQRTVDDGKALHSMHSYFMRPADIGAEVRYEVETLRDGRGYSTRQVRAFQRGKAVYACLASFATGLQQPAEPGGEYAADFPSAIPAPETLPSSAEYLADRSGGSMTAESKAYWSGGRGFDMRHVPGPVYLTVDGARLPHQAVWVRPFDALRPVDGLTSAQRDLAALAYVCDYTILEPVLRVLGLPWADETLVTASLDHAMWFHRTGRVDGWLLYAQQAGAAGSGRGLAIGRFFDADRTHLATVMQEGMIRTASGGQP